MSEEIVVTDSSGLGALSVDDVIGQVTLIQSIMSRVMKKDEHYGKIPGCGPKPTLLKPGAEKLCFTFRLRPLIEASDITLRELRDEHREYEVICHLNNRHGEELASGVGSCNTLESKYRYRTEATGKSVPKEYWKDRDVAKLGGPGYAPKKQDGSWVIVHKVEHDNPADYYNTVLKMAKKRAFVDATLSGTAASDMFTQDVEEMGAVIGTQQAKPATAAKPAVKMPERQQPSGADANGDPGHAHEPQPEAEGRPDTMQEGACILEGIVDKVGQKSGEGKKGPWTVYSIYLKDGSRFGTFDTKLAEDAKALKESGARAECQYEVDGKFKNLIGIWEAGG